MTTNIRRDDEFMGLPIRKVRDILRAWRLGNGDPVGIGSRADVGEDPRRVLAVLAELEENGLIGDERNAMFGASYRGLTDRGFGLTSSTATRRAPKRNAQKVLDALLDRAAGINGDPDVTLCADRIWVFGSMIDPEREDVGDIDFVVENSVKVSYKKMCFTDRIRHVMERFADHIRKGSDPIVDDLETQVFRKRLYGGRRHPLLAPNNLECLRSLHRPCQLVFDASRGGRVDDPVLPHHPESTERAATIQERLSVPTLAVGFAMSPSDARFLQDGTAPFEMDGQMRTDMRYVAPRPRRNSNRGADDAYPYGRIIATPENARDHLSAVLPSGDLPAELAVVDGKNRFAIAFSRGPFPGRSAAPCWIIVDRSVHLHDDRWIHLTHVHLGGTGDFRFTEAELEWAKLAVAMLVGADGSRLYERRQQAPSRVEIDMVCEASGPTDQVDALLRRLHSLPGEGVFRHMSDADEDAIALLIEDEHAKRMTEPPSSHFAAREAAVAGM